MRSLVALLAAVNPLAVAIVVGATRDRVRVAVGVAVAAALATALAAMSDGVLDLLDVSPPTFRLATALVLGIAAIRWVAVGANAAGANPAGDGEERRWRWVLVPLLVPALVTPQLVTVCVSVGADDGVALVGAGAALAGVLTWLATSARRRPAPLWGAGVRLTGAVGLVVAIALAVDGVKSV